MTNWKAIAARITLFPNLEATTVQQQSALAWYKEMWGSDPQSFQDAPVPNFPSNARGIVGSLQVTCIKNLNRIDFNFLPPPLQSEAQPRVPNQIQTIDNAAQLHNELRKTAEHAAESLIANAYTGFALFLHFAAPDQQDIVQANKSLLSAIPKQYRPELTDEEDFVLQLNRPYASPHVDGIRTNFIVKWSIDRIRVLSFGFPLSGMAPGISPQGMSQRDFITPAVTFETNNMPQGSDTRLNPNQVASLLLEGLSTVNQSQQQIGLNIDGFPHVAST